MKPMLEADNVRLEEIRLAKEESILSLLVPEDPRDTTDILLEIRAGAGGDESSIFAGEIMRAYAYLADQIGCKLKIIEREIYLQNSSIHTLANMSIFSNRGILVFFQFINNCGQGHLENPARLTPVRH